MRSWLSLVPFEINKSVVEVRGSQHEHKKDYDYGYSGPGGQRLTIASLSSPPCTSEACAAASQEMAGVGGRKGIIMHWPHRCACTQP